jgi:tetratricopeptide (TPR) repeat protein
MRRYAWMTMFALTFPVWAASPAKELAGVTVRIGDIEGSLRALQEDFSQRKGLLGTAEARMRYTEAVYYFLMGEYGKSARAFFTLVESGALVDKGLLGDSEWFLGESLFEMGNLTLAEEAYQSIIDQGFGHPFFSDAVRRQLEVYGLTGKADRFFSLYNSYVVTNRVKPNDLIVYTLGKSFYRQKDFLRAKSLFTDIQPESPLYGKARYFLGTVRVVEKNLTGAIAEFTKATEVSAEDETQSEVVELAHLALGRLYFETDQLDASSTHYQRIGRDSKYFSEALYEMVWTYIKDESYNEALRAVEIFLLAFPEHQFTAELKLLQGNLHMKLLNYKQALDTYEGVVQEYSPIQIRLDQLALDAMQSERWFKKLTELDDASGYETSGLPAFAVEMLVNQPDFSRTKETVSELNFQQEEITDSEEIIAEIEAALGGELETLGSFRRAREQLEQVYGEVLRLQIEMLSVKEQHLLETLKGSAVSALRPLQTRLQQLADAERRVSDISSKASDKLQVYDEQVRSVQSRAFRSYQEVNRLREEADALVEMLDSGNSPLWSEHVVRVRAKILKVRTALDEEIRVARSLQSDVARRTIIAPVERSSGQVDTRRARDLIQKELGALHVQFQGVEKQVGGSNILGEWKEAWQRLAKIGSGAAAVAKSMNNLESTEILSVRSRLQVERLSVEAARIDVNGLGGEAQVLAIDVTKAGFAELEGVFGSQILRADVGIVDVYWNEKNLISEEIERLQVTKKEREDALRARFDRLDQVMGE